MTKLSSEMAQSGTTKRSPGALSSSYTAIGMMIVFDTD
jgi:hypothetical protein